MSEEDTPTPGLPEDLAPRLGAVLARRSLTNSQDDPETARGWLDASYEAAYAEDLALAGRAARAGLQARGGQDPFNRAGLLRALASVAEMQGDHAAATRYIAERSQLLVEAGYPHQARMESELGTMLLREPESFEATVLEGLLEAERARSARSVDTVLPDVLVALAVRNVEDGRLDPAVDLLEECLDILDARVGAGIAVAPESLSSTRMFLAHVHLMSHEPESAAEVADEVLAGKANRAVRAAMWMLKAVVAHELGDAAQAAADALRAVELHAAAGVRKGAASAAALLAGLAHDAGDQQSSILAWKVAVAQAEQGEVPEASDLTLALGHQLLEAEEHALAERVLAGLVRREEAARRLPGLARALVDLGHAARHQGRPDEALEHWDRASGLFQEAGSLAEAARMCLAAGALLNRQERAEDAAERFSRAVELARRVEDEDDPAVLPQALHALGHVLCELGQERGVALLDEAIALAQDSSAAWHEADFTDTRARGLWALRQGPAAVSSALTAADLFAASQDTTAASNAELFAAYVLLEQERAEEAASLFRMITEQQDTARYLRMAAWLGLAQSLDLAGDEEGAALARLRADAASSEQDPDPQAEQGGDAHPEADLDQTFDQALDQTLDQALDLALELDAEQVVDEARAPDPGQDPDPDADQDGDPPTG
ncbi:tetratricopeptide repeat protein [Micrococcus sp. TA1]|uniref:tetratricopeptide repeat protein n=1 Tax=Micrococcus sp. TA1 TaxID=681627 RepID=UPI0016213D72|nr:tetratricopeptide (TPR) repeat protein [Micrococcus sp. TA1]